MSILGHVISGKGVLVDLGKVMVVIECKRLTNMSEIISLLGLAGSYKHFIEGFSKLVGPLNAIIRKNVVTRKNARFE